MNPITLEVISSLKQCSKSDWDALEHSFPFSRYEFLLALELGGCTTQDRGWSPYILIFKNKDRLVGALYGHLKNHSYGEYIFDWAIAEAYQEAGLPYYPKYASSVPFTPAEGHKFLFSSILEEVDREHILTMALEHLKKLSVSSLHWLFTSEQDNNLMRLSGLLPRSSFQYHWVNSYTDFEDFFRQLKSRKAKMIKKERQVVTSYNLDIRILTGKEAQTHLQDIYQLYLSTIAKKGAIPYLTPSFFEQLGQSSAPLFCLAFKNDLLVAFSLFFMSKNCLYGRYWGIRPDLEQKYPLLHFEMCYYRGMDLCFDHQLEKFEAGAQGEHKIPRGFLPTQTSSWHHFSHPKWKNLVQDYFQREARELQLVMKELELRKSPYKKCASP